MGTLVEFKLSFPDAGETCEVSVEIEQEDLSVLVAYQRYCSELIDTSLVKLGMPHLKNLRWDGIGGFSIKTSRFDVEHVYAFLHKCRPLMLSEEHASFERTKGLLGRIFQQYIPIRKHLKAIGHRYSNGEYASYFQVTVGDVSLFSDQAFRLWLNAREYHRDQDKSEEVKEIEKVFLEENVRKIFLIQLTEKTTAIFALNKFVGNVLSKSNA